MEDELRVKREENKNAFAALTGKTGVSEVHPRHYKAITVSVLDGSLMAIRNV